MSKHQKQQLAFALGASLFLLLVPLAGIYAGGSNVSDALVALAISQLGVFTLWLIMRFGLFATSSYSSRRYFKSLFYQKDKSRGGYEATTKSQAKAFYWDDPKQLAKASQHKSKIGIYTGIAIGLCELIAAIIVSFT